jgi:hypothetical protein
MDRSALNFLVDSEHFPLQEPADHHVSNLDKGLADIIT